MTRFGFERPPGPGPIDFSDYPSWQRRLLALVRGVLAKRTYDNPETGDDPEDDAEMWEGVLSLAWPPDGRDKAVSEKS